MTNWLLRCEQSLAGYQASSALLIASHWLMMAFYSAVCLHQAPIVRINGQRWNKTDKPHDTASLTTLARQEQVRSKYGSGESA